MIKHGEISNQNHFKRLLIMEYVALEDKFLKNSQFNFIKLDNKSAELFEHQNFARIKAGIKKGIPYTGVLDKNGQPLAFGCTQTKGNRGDYFDIQECDVYLSNLYVFPEYRGRGIMKELIDFFVWQKGSYRLAVRSNNSAAIRCYTKYGFYKLKEVRLCRIIRNWSIPRYKI